MRLHVRDPLQRDKVGLMDKLLKLINVHVLLRHGFLIRRFLALMQQEKAPHRYRLNRSRYLVKYQMELSVIQFFHH